MLTLRNGKEILKVSKKNWNLYLNIVSPYRKADKSYMNCSLKDRKDLMWCDTCNTAIGNFSKSCVNTITSLNLQKYSTVLFKDFNEMKDDYHEIDVDRNDNNSTI
jgi:hypothetical protein